MRTQVKSFEQLKKAWDDGKQLTRNEWPKSAFIQNVCSHCINSGQMFDIEGWQIIEPDLMVPDSVGFFSSCKCKRILLTFGTRQCLGFDDDSYKVLNTWFLCSVRPKLSLNKTTFGQLQPGEWFYTGYDDGCLTEKAYYHLKINNTESAAVVSNKWVAGCESQYGDCVHKLVEVKE